MSVPPFKKKVHRVAHLLHDVLPGLRHGIRMSEVGETRGDEGAFVSVALRDEEVHELLDESRAVRSKGMKERDTLRHL